MRVRTLSALRSRKWHGVQSAHWADPIFPLEYANSLSLRPNNPKIMSLSLRTLLSLILLSLLLPACGQKGPLFLPSEDPASKEEQR